MSYIQLSIKNFSLSFSNKMLLDDVSLSIAYGKRIGLIGRNGSGKSTLLNYIFQQALMHNEHVAYVEQSLLPENKSGGELLSQSLLRQISQYPSLLLIDEPSNHLDENHREKVLSALKRFSGTCIMVSHDEAFLQILCDEIWSIEGGDVIQFDGRYDDFCNFRDAEMQKAVVGYKQIKQSRKQNHQALMQEQKRAANAKKKGIKNIKSNKYPTVKSLAKADRGNSTTQKNKKVLNNKKQKLMVQQQQFEMVEALQPSFQLNAKLAGGVILHVENGAFGFNDGQWLQANFNLTINSGDRIWLKGRNGSGKTTLLKALLGAKNFVKEGVWQVPNVDDIGYIEQHYQNLPHNKSVIEALSVACPEWSHQLLRVHLNHFLFRKPEEVDTLTQNLSGGEKARLSLALIAANPPKLLIVDEISNNLDLIHKQYIKQILAQYPGAFLVTCHEPAFVEALKISKIIDM